MLLISDEYTGRFFSPFCHLALYSTIGLVCDYPNTQCGRNRDFKVTTVFPNQHFKLLCLNLSFPSSQLEGKGEKLTLDITEDANSFRGVQKEEVIISPTTGQNIIIYLFPFCCGFQQEVIKARLWRPYRKCHV